MSPLNCEFLKKKYWCNKPIRLYKIKLYTQTKYLFKNLVELHLTNDLNWIGSTTYTIPDDRYI